ncbi:PREDICTED: skin secretory protein xP2-like [Chinchilla lanigera]|uniref:skin secretory protein xP2-like n=1 Tax=Chinchilla lanigera TaxID=34839 RepID=UPI000696BCDA|nr:PREDICTED: skin secretory protein xP2-like [Chinchilla lanigera]
MEKQGGSSLLPTGRTPGPAGPAASGTGGGGAEQRPLGPARDRPVASARQTCECASAGGVRAGGARSRGGGRTRAEPSPAAKIPRPGGGEDKEEEEEEEEERGPVPRPGYCLRRPHKEPGRGRAGTPAQPHNSSPEPQPHAGRAPAWRARGETEARKGPRTAVDCLEGQMPCGGCAGGASEQRPAEDPRVEGDDPAVTLQRGKWRRGVAGRGPGR